jgi:hypothetical protein
MHTGYQFACAPGRANRGNDAGTRARSQQFVVPESLHINLGHELARTLRAELGRASPFSSVLAANGHGSQTIRVERRAAQWLPSGIRPLREAPY